MAFSSILIANRGEIAIRIARACAELGITAKAIYSEDDANSRHRQLCDEALPLKGRGVAAYLDQQQIIALAQAKGCDAIHPGYGFLSENADFAQACEAAGIHFIGPSAEALTLFGDKVRARDLAKQCGVPVSAASEGPSTRESLHGFFDQLADQLAKPAMIIKAVAGGGGRGMRVVTNKNEIDSAFERCQSEAQQAFGNPDVYGEAYIPNARHIEIQIVADNQGHAIHLGERDCSLQRRHQKIIEVAPSPALSPQQRESLCEAALAMARAANYNNIGTFEFLLAADSDAFYFIEANPRLQVEHTVTEAISNVDLVQSQILIAAGNSLADIGLAQTPPLKGFALQARVNLESLEADGTIKPSGGLITHFETPSGPGIRVDTFGYSGYETSPNYDSLLAKVICWSAHGDWQRLLKKSAKALNEFRISGAKTNLPMLKALLQTPEVREWDVHTRWLDDQLPALARAIASAPEVKSTNHEQTLIAPNANRKTLPNSLHAIHSPLQGTLVKLLVAAGDEVYQGQDLLVLESMKMEHVIKSEIAGRIEQILVSPGATLRDGDILLGIHQQEVVAPDQAKQEQENLDTIRGDLAEVIRRHEYGQDEHRPDAVARRRKTGQRTARENIADLCDDGSFVEYGSLTIASQRARRSLQELLEKTPADGMVGGVGRVNGELFGADASQCIAMSYDYTVFAGTQGQKNHRKKDRLFELAEQARLPVVIFAEGGGGRPGETERTGVSGLDCLAFLYFAQLKGLVPLISIVSGRCFAGNAVLAGCSDVIIATENSNIGMAGPAMVEGGGLGLFKAEEIGPLSDHRYNGVVDVAVKDEAEAVQVAKQYLSYLQGPLKEWQCVDQRLLRSVIPENRLRVYDVRDAINLLADTDSVLELRKDFAPGMVTAFARVEGRPIGIVANNPMHLGGAIDSPGSDKGARFIHQCNAYGIPVLFLCDTPGIMVGPEAERSGLVRHAARMFIAGASLQVPYFCIVLRKAYGLGAQTMAGGSMKAPFFTVSWPTGEFGGMGLEGAVRLGYRNEIAAIEDPDERQAFFQEMVDKMYEIGKATSVASYFEIDDVIDPAESRRWIVRGLEATQNMPRGERRFVDTW